MGFVNSIRPVYSAGCQEDKMNPFDMAVAVILVFFVIVGLFRGSVREVTSVVALVGGFYLACLYYEPFAMIFSAFIKSGYIRNILSFLVLFGIVVLGVTLIGNALRAFLKLVMLGMMDRFLGGVIGAVKAVLVIFVLHFLALTFLPSGGAAMVNESVMAPAISSTVSAAVSFIPEEIKRDFTARLEGLRRHWKTGPGNPPVEGQPDDSPDDSPDGTDDGEPDDDASGKTFPNASATASTK